jgi:exodeoxyribonuclease VII small subunit
MSETTRSFEQALSELESHVRKLDSGELPLEEALEVFEAGIKLQQECAELLDATEQRIVELSGEGETIEERPSSQTLP